MNLEETVVPIQVVNELVMILHASARIATVRHKTTLMAIYKVYPPTLNKCGQILKYITVKGRKNMTVRSKEEYTYLEWLTSIRFAVNTYIDHEIMRISHDDSDEQPREIMDRIKSAIDRAESQIPDDM